MILNHGLIACNSPHDLVTLYLNYLLCSMHNRYMGTWLHDHVHYSNLLMPPETFAPECMTCTKFKIPDVDSAYLIIEVMGLVCFFMQCMVSRI